MARSVLHFITSIRQFRSLRRCGERGQVLMIGVLILPILLGASGLVIDYGIAAAARRDTQNAVDAAALAAAGVRVKGGSISDATTAANSYITKNGYSSSNAHVYIPPTTGAHAGDSNYVEVTLTTNPPTAFVRTVGINSVTITSRGVAGFNSSAVKHYAMVVLDPTMCSSYSQSSGNTLTLNGGGVMVNSSCKPSGNQGGGSTLKADFVDYYSAGSWQLSNNASTSIAATAVTSTITDPLASKARPDLSTLSVSSDSGGTAASPSLKQVNSDATLHPGIYYGGLKISGSPTITFQAGLYVFAGGGFTYSASATLSGTDVTFFNTSDPYASHGGSCASIALQGSGSISLSAPTSGTYKNMLFWQADDCTAQMKYAGSSYLTVGVIYLPKAELNVSGGGTLGALQIVVNNFSYTGSSSVTVNYADYVPIAPPTFKLVE